MGYDMAAIQRNVWVLMAAIAGAVTALSMKRWKSMSPFEVGITLFAGTSFAVFVAPWVAHDLLSVPIDNARTLACVTYAFAMSSNVLIPVVVKGLRWLATRWFGLPPEEGEGA